MTFTGKSIVSLLLELMLPTSEHIDIDVQSSRRLTHAVSLLGDQVDGGALALSRIIFAFLSHHSTPPVFRISLFSRCPYTLDHNRLMTGSEPTPERQKRFL